MERSIASSRKGDIVSVPFPFSDTSATKRRPALVIAKSDSNNVLLCPITSKPGRDHKITLEDQDFRVGKLNLSPCYIHPNIIATIDKANIIRLIGHLKSEKLSEAIYKIIEILQKPHDPPPPLSQPLQRGKKP